MASHSPFQRFKKFAQKVANIGTFDWNIKTGVNMWTPELEAMYGLPIGGFGRTQPAWEALVHPDDRARAVQRVQESFETGTPVEAEWRVIRPDGSVRWRASFASTCAGPLIDRHSLDQMSQPACNIVTGQGNIPGRSESSSQPSGATRS
jgi:PAS domain-containing protein